MINDASEQLSQFNRTFCQYFRQSQRPSQEKQLPEFLDQFLAYPKRKKMSYHAQKPQQPSFENLMKPFMLTFKKFKCLNITSGTIQMLGGL